MTTNINENLEKVHCSLCGENDYSIKHIIKGYNMVECSRCGLVYVNPRPYEEQVLETYDEDYYAGKGTDKKNRLFNEYLEKTERKVDSWRGRFLGIQRLISTGKLMDVGCAFGEFLDVVVENRWEAYGVEPSSFSGKYLKKRFNNNVVISTFKDGLFSARSFDVITMFEVIEHLYNPLEYLLTANRYLKKGGLIVVQTGDVESGQAKREGAKWQYYIPPAHVHYFSKKTLIDALKKAGFKPIFTIRGGSVKTFKVLRFLGLDRVTSERKFLCKLRELFLFLSYRMFFVVSKIIGYPGMTLYARKIKDI